MDAERRNKRPEQIEIKIRSFGKEADTFPRMQCPDVVHVFGAMAKSRNTIKHMSIRPQNTIQVVMWV